MRVRGKPLESLEELRRLVEACRKCELWKVRRRPVFGEGPADAEVMAIGLGPGYHENLQGRPFVGAAGKLLDELLALAGLDRAKIYITNVVKCYLPDNKPTESQVRTCASNYLDKQVAIINPKVILALGSVAAEYAFKKFGLPLRPMGSIHGQLHEARSLFGPKLVIPMYHPAAALRNPGLREVVAEDWRRLKEALSERLGER